MKRFELQFDGTSGVPKFFTTKRRMVFRLVESDDKGVVSRSEKQPSLEAEVAAFKEAMENVIIQALSRVGKSDLTGLTFEFNGSEGNRPGYLTFRRASQITFSDVWSVLESIAQSNASIMGIGQFQLVVTSIQLPAGQGQGRKGKYNTFEEECRKRRGIVTIKNNDNLCLPRALVVGRALAIKDLEYTRIRRSQGLQKQKAVELMLEAGVSIPTEGAGVDEIKGFQSHLSNFKITVYRFGTKGREVIFEGPDAPLAINLLHGENHFNVISSLTSAFTCVYFCESCHTPYDHKNDHRCSKSCAGCGSSPPCTKEAVLIKCQDCKRTFYSQVCYDNHRGKMCATVHKCESCFSTINVELRKSPHVCGEMYCGTCQEHKPAGHFCFITPAKEMSKKQDTLFVFFDLETRQEREISPGVNVHEPNLCVFTQVCPECYTDSSRFHCSRCGVREQVLLTDKCIEGFMAYLMESRKKFKKVVAIAHNAQAFDGQFILNHLLTKTSLKPELIMRGSKILMLEVDNLRFIDSLNYFPMALSSLPKAFDLPSPKGHFPHLFNTTANANYVGPLPAISYYCPDAMKPEMREELLQWHEASKGTTFDMQRDLVGYCRTDVEILKGACLRFRDMFLEECGVDPFTEAITIASACNLMFRRKYLRPNTIGVIPKGGYRRADSQSAIALQWLLREEERRGVVIQHAGRQREASVAGAKVDGLYEKTVFQFHGCYYHGCPLCYSVRRTEPLHDDPCDTMELRYERTLNRSENLKTLGYEVVEEWECAFKRQVSTAELNLLALHPMLRYTPLSPRDGFYGGRTGAAKLKYTVAPGEKIRYVDVCSLYPWVCKYGKFPVGHPQVYVGVECDRLVKEKGLSGINGAMKCTVLPPQHLYHPVLPVKLNNKLLFSLCRTCAETLSQEGCIHDVLERAITGTWISDEVVKAVAMGYKILEIQEVWEYQVTQFDKLSKTGGLFSKFIDQFLKLKQEASGYPSGCHSADDQARYIEEYSAMEGVLLDASKITKNPGRRSLAKLMLNSFWGKFGQRENQSKTKIINDSKEYIDLISNPCIDLNHVLEVNDDVLAVNWSYKEEAVEPLSTVNVVIASYVTTQARLKLYSYLEQMGERVLYYDTDSVIYVAIPGEPELPTGRFLGDLTDELQDYGEGAYISEFVSGGPKNYGYKVYSPLSSTSATTVKVKGITLNYAAAQIVNFNTMTELLSDPHGTRKVLVEGSAIRRTVDHQVVTKQEAKSYSVNFKKRRRIGDFDSVPFGYKKPHTSIAQQDPPCN